MTGDWSGILLYGRDTTDVSLMLLMTNASQRDRPTHMLSLVILLSSTTPYSYHPNVPETSWPSFHLLLLLLITLAIPPAVTACPFKMGGA